LATALKNGQPVPIGYQWQRNDGAGWSNIPNQTAASYYLVPTAADFSAEFRVLALVPGKEVPSNVVKLSTEPVGPPEIAISRGASGVTITYTGTLESATQVQGPYTTVAGAGSPYTVANPEDTKFYRTAK
jgi:hypothetical protein